MIPANKSALFSRVFAWDCERRLRRSFEAVYGAGIGSLGESLQRGPVLVVTNHTAWWDALLAIFVSVRVLRADAYAMMDAANLARFPFFAKVGAFGVDLADPADGARAIRHAAKLLAAGRRLVWVFPQGREVPVTVRPVAFRPGSAEIARVARGAAVVAGAIRYEMGATARPTVWLSFGPEMPRAGTAPDARRVQEQAVTRELDRIEGAVARGETEGFTPLLAPRRDRLFSVAQRALAFMTRPKLQR